MVALLHLNAMVRSLTPYGSFFQLEIGFSEGCAAAIFFLNVHNSNVNLEG